MPAKKRAREEQEKADVAARTAAHRASRRGEGDEEVERLRITGPLAAVRLRVASFVEEHLGRVFERSGKAAVVEAAAAAGRGCGGRAEVDGFSKQCGLLRWRNCVMLWVNLQAAAGCTSPYSNEFYVKKARGGCAHHYVTFWGKASMTASSVFTRAVVATCPKARAAAAEDESSSSSDGEEEYADENEGGGKHALLIVRETPTSPYCLLGRVTCVLSQVVDSRIRFTLRLDDAAALAACDTFRGLYA